MALNKMTPKDHTKKIHTHTHTVKAMLFAVNSQYQL